MKFQKGHKLGLGNKYRLNKIPWNKGLKGICKSTSGSFPKGYTPWNKGMKTGIVPKTAFKKGNIVPKGKEHWAWKGGKDERKYLMMQKEYILWRTAVFMRDNYTCVNCHQKGGRLQADHIKPWSLYPELRYAIDNGRTLCIECHKNTETYGWKIYHLRKEIN